MKKPNVVIGLISLLAAAALLAIYVIAWVALVNEHGADALRIGLTLWPGNVIGYALLAVTLLLGGCGLVLLASKD